MITGMGRNQNDGGRHGNHLVGPVVEESLQLVDVVVEDGHEIAGGLFLEVGHFEMLHMGVGVESQLVLDCLGEVAPGNRLEVLEHRLERPNDKGEDSQDYQLRSGSFEPVVGEECPFLVDDDVYRHADENGRQDVECLVQHRPQDGANQAPAMGFGIAPESAEWLLLHRSSTIGVF